MAQANTMESAKHCIQNKDAIQKPEDVCEKCGKPIDYYFNDWSNKWRSNGCLNCQYLGIKETIKEKCKSTMIDRGISKRYLDASLDDFPKNYTSELKADKSIYLYGSRGTGKTHFMAAMMKHDIINTEPAEYKSCEYKGYDEPIYSNYPIFIAVPELLLKIRSTFNKSGDGETESSLIEKYSNTKILYLDDLGTEKPSDWVVQVLYLLIDRRYSEMKRTIISSNFNLNEIADRLDDRISSRIAGMCEIIKMSGKDKRLNN